VEIVKEENLCPVIKIFDTPNRIYYVENFVQRETSFTIKVLGNTSTVIINFHDLTTQDCLDIFYYYYFIFYFLFIYFDSSED
jgi:hypothetical protein